MEKILLIWEGHARPSQIMVIAALYYGGMYILRSFENSPFSDLGILAMALDFSVGTWMTFGAWRTYQNYEEDPLRIPALLLAFGGGVFMLLGGK